MARTEAGLLVQLGVILATGNMGVVEARPRLRGVACLPGRRHRQVVGLDAAGDLRAVLFAGERRRCSRSTPLAAREGRIVPVLAGEYALDRLLESSVSTNTAAAGGNASLMAIG